METLDWTTCGPFHWLGSRVRGAMSRRLVKIHPPVVIFPLRYREDLCLCSLGRAGPKSQTTYSNFTLKLLLGLAYQQSTYWEARLLLPRGDMGTRWSRMTDICMYLVEQRTPLSQMTSTAMTWIVRPGVWLPLTVKGKYSKNRSKFRWMVYLPTAVRLSVYGPFRKGSTIVEQVCRQHSGCLSVSHTKAT